MAIRFGEEHLHAFARASLDTSPLHTSEDYARTTPYGQRVVYGGLGFLACLGGMVLPGAKSVAAVRVEYKGPVFLGVDYTLHVKEEEGADIVRASLLDGSVIVLRIRLQLRDGTPRLAALPEEGAAPLIEARRIAGFHPGLRFAGRYGPPRRPYLELLAMTGIDRERWGDALIVTALCASYLTGMELPGESAAFGSWKAAISDRPVELPCDFAIALDSFDARFSRAESEFQLGTFARGTLTAIARPDRRKIAAPATSVPQPRNGKIALVIGASRGLGAAIALALVAEGCTVVGAYHRSKEEAESLTAAGVAMERGDASDPQWCASLRERIQSQFGRLDVLILCAAPAILPLRVEQAHLARIQAYLQKGFALAAAPLAAFLDLVEASEGAVLLISSSAVERPPAAWPHYVALKGALEGLVQAAAADHSKVRFTIARPDRIETDLINTPMGRLDAESPASAARRILDAVADRTAPGTVRFVS